MATYGAEMWRLKEQIDNVLVQVAKELLGIGKWDI